MWTVDVIKEPICILMQVWQFLEVRIPRGAASNPLYHGPIGSSTLMATLPGHKTGAILKIICIELFSE